MRRCPDLILCDWRMPGRDGGELLDDVRARALGCAFIVMTAYGSIAHAVDAIHRGRTTSSASRSSAMRCSSPCSGCCVPGGWNGRTGSCAR